MMKGVTSALVVAFATSSKSLAYAEIKIAQYGGCLNATRQAENPQEGEMPHFHCHYDSSSCASDERWLNPVEVAAEGHGPCTCDDTFETNVYGFGCYDMSGSHAVKCTSTEDQCPDDWYHLGHRYNSDDIILDSCGHGSNASSDRTENESCGKRCTCHYHYALRTNPLASFTTQYGLCYNPVSRDNYCAVSNTTCHSSETFYGALSTQTENVDCPCHKTEVGACLNSDNAFSHCSVAADGCTSSQRFLSRNELKQSSSLDIKCRLCEMAEEGDDNGSGSSSTGSSKFGGGITTLSGVVMLAGMVSTFLL